MMNHRNFAFALTAVLLASPGITARIAHAEEVGTMPHSETASSGVEAKEGGPTDPEIAHIVVTADKIDIAAGKLAEARSKNKDVRAFAKRMVTDHTAVNMQASALAKKLGVTPKDNPTSKSLQSGADANMAKLKTLKGHDFDKEYVDHEVSYHEAVLGAIDQTLLPDVKNTELKALITKVRPAIAAHLEHAKQMQTAFNK